jgi:hypothetical protein
LVQLRRTRVGPFAAEEAVKPVELQAESIAGRLRGFEAKSET